DAARLAGRGCARARAAAPGRRHEVAGHGHADARRRGGVRPGDPPTADDPGKLPLRRRHRPAAEQPVCRGRLTAGMALDPGAARLLRMLAAAGAGGPAAEGPAERRSRLQTLARVAGEDGPPGVDTQDFEAAGPGGPLRLRLYAPAPGGSGALVYSPGRRTEPQPKRAAGSGRLEV